MKSYGRFFIVFFANIDKRIKMCYTYLCDGMQIVPFYVTFNHLIDKPFISFTIWNH